ncbi:MAG: terminase, partial [Gammaproteobacteria bacterium]|nr:terminase [Gammaproteobacteria bacterium]
MANSTEIEKFLIQKAHDYRHNPLGFVKFAWDDVTPRKWQEEILTEIGDKLKSGELDTHSAIQEAVASGHGIG